MPKPPTVTLDDLPKDVQSKIRKSARIPRRSAFTKEHVRSHALRVLALIADLTQDQRKRVLAHAVKVNNV